MGLVQEEYPEQTASASPPRAPAKTRCVTEMDVITTYPDPDLDVCAVEAAVKVVNEAGDEEFRTQILFNLFHEAEQLLELRLMCSTAAELD